MIMRSIVKIITLAVALLAGATPNGQERQLLSAVGDEAQRTINEFLAANYRC